MYIFVVAQSIKPYFFSQFYNYKKNKSLQIKAFTLVNLNPDTDPGQATGKVYHLQLRVECTLFCNLRSWARTYAVLVIGLYELLDPTT
jgi:hypothetical protein